MTNTQVLSREVIRSRPERRDGRIMQLVVLACGLGLAAAWPLIAPSPYWVSVGTLALTYCLLAQSLNVIYGFTGYMSFGQTFFFGIGGYVVAILCTRTEINPWFGILIAGIFSAVMAAVTGAPGLRVNRHSFAIYTLILLLLATIVARDWTSVTGGSLGIVGLPTLSFELVGLSVDVATPEQFYWANLLLTAVVVGLLFFALSSRWGRTLKAIRQDEVLVASFGINVYVHKMAAFICAGFVAGIAGGFHALRISVVEPTIFALAFIAVMLLAVFVGGGGYLWGPMIAAVAFTFAPELLRDTATEWRLALYGALITVVAALPRDSIRTFISKGLLAVIPTSRDRAPRRDRAQSSFKE